MAMPAYRPRGDDHESGRILLLSLGFTVIGLMIVAVVVAATAVHLDRKRLYNLADIAAVEAAQSLSTEYFGSQSAPPGDLAIAPRGVAAAAADSVERNVQLGVGRLAQVRVVQATTSDGVTAEVTLAAVTDPPLIGWFTREFTGGIGITATSRARSPLG